MLERIQSFFLRIAGMTTDDNNGQDDLRIAVAALCYQVMEADGTVTGSEKERLGELLGNYYHLDRRDTDALIAAGKAAGSEAVDYYRFTSGIRRKLDESQRVELVGILWDIVYADGQRTEMEDHVIWRIAELLGVSGEERLKGRRAAEASAPKQTGEDDTDAV